MERGVVDPTDRKVALLLHGDLPEQGRPELGAWLDGLKADPSKAPRQLAHVWTPPASTGQQTGTGQGTTTGTGTTGTQRQVQPPPKVGEGSGTAGSQVTKEQIRAAGQRARSPNATDADRAAYHALTQQLDREISGR